MFLELCLGISSFAIWYFTSYYSVISLEDNTKTEISFGSDFPRGTGSIFRVREKTEGYFALLTTTISVLLILVSISTYLNIHNRLFKIITILLNFGLYVVCMLHIRDRYKKNIEELILPTILPTVTCVIVTLVGIFINHLAVLILFCTLNFVLYIALIFHSRSRYEGNTTELILIKAICMLVVPLSSNIAMSTNRLYGVIALSLTLYITYILHLRSRYEGNTAKLEYNSYVFKEGALAGLKLTSVRKYFFCFDLKITEQPNGKAFKLEPNFSTSIFRFVNLVAFSLYLGFLLLIAYIVAPISKILDTVYTVGLKYSIIYIVYTVGLKYSITCCFGFLISTWFINVLQISVTCWLFSHYFIIENKATNHKHYISYKFKWYTFIDEFDGKLPFFVFLIPSLLQGLVYEVSECPEKKNKLFLPSQCIIMSLFGLAILSFGMYLEKASLSILCDLLCFLLLVYFVCSISFMMNAYRYRQTNTSADIVDDVFVFSSGELSGLKLKIKPRFFIFSYDPIIEDDNGRFALSPCHPWSTLVVKWTCIFVSFITIASLFCLCLCVNNITLFLLQNYTQSILLYINTLYCS